MSPAYAAADLAAWTDGRWTAAPAAPVTGFGIDTRALRAGEAFVAVENLFDEDYSFRAGYPMPGRSYQFGLRASF